MHAIFAVIEAVLIRTIAHACEGQALDDNPTLNKACHT